MAQPQKPETKSSGKRAAQKASRNEKNKAQHEANLATMRELGISPRVASVTRFRNDHKGNNTPYIKSYDVRPSKLIRTERRAQARAAAGK